MSYTNGLDKPTDYFNTLLRNGTGTGNTAVTGVGFQPDLVWQKRRNTTGHHFWTDVVRGSSNKIYSSSTSAEETDANWVVSFDSDGYTMGSSDYGTSDTVASWNWKAGGTASSNTDGSITSSVSANTTAGFSIVSYTGTGANATVGHGLGSAPKVVIVKDRDNTNAWVFGSDMVGWTGYLLLNSTNASATNSINWQDTAPTSSVFSVGTNTGVNNTGGMIAYCFAEKKGYSKFGSYTGNGNADGTFIYTGFKPAFAIFKNTSGTGDWLIYDNKRNPSNVTNKGLKAHSSDAEASFDNLDMLSNGFKLRRVTSSLSTSGSTYIYMAFAENPFVSSTGIPTTAR